LDTIQEIKSSLPEVKVIILTLFDNPRYREIAKNKGADGFVIKNKFVGELIPKIKQALGK
jgi:DNA-binding NarL/FixJ family response regulator